MNPGFLVSLFATVISTLFALMVFNQWRARQHIHQLWWAVGLWLFAFACAFQTLAEWRGWEELVYKSWYITGAQCGAAYLGMGTLYLLLPRRIAHAILGCLLLTTVVSAVMVITTSIPSTFFGNLVGGFPSSHSGLAVFPVPVRILTALLNIFGTVALCGGAVVSAVQLWRSKKWSKRIASNFFIAGGTLVVAMGATMATFDVPALLYISQLSGISLIFYGFLVARVRQTTPSLAPQPQLIGENK